MRSKYAFTLIELLVVISIIGILAALLLPALAASKRHGQQSRCLGNVKQLTLASFMYASDSGSQAAYNMATAANSLWMGMGYYDNQRQILNCPSTHDTVPAPVKSSSGAADLTWVWAPSATNSYSGSYALNGWLYDADNFSKTVDPALMMSKQSMIQRPAQTPVFCDAMWVDLWPLETDLPCTDLYAGTRNGKGMTRCTIVRHEGCNPASAPRDFDISKTLPGALNIGMADGHMELVKLEKLWQCYWHLDWVPPPTRPQ
jgi:prepilin-type N-terminal cleavage/methylation domain-containing protein